MKCAAADPASSHFFRTGLYTRFADWKFIHRVRLNLLPPDGRSYNQISGDRSCRRCGRENGTLPHVIIHCMRYSDLSTRRHNAVVNRVRKAAQSKYTILAENVVVQGNLRLDLVVVKNNKVIIIDITVPFENKMEALNQARLLKLQKYEDLPRALSGRFADVEVDAVVFGSSGSWDPENDKVMMTMCSRKY
jgi:hypothetical protein